MMQFVLTGFTQDLGCRVFAFEGVAADRSRTAFSVRIDLGVSRRYGIRLQELPLLCRALLERGGEPPTASVLTYTEEDMSIHARECAARVAATQKKTMPRRPSTVNLGTGWRIPQREL